MKAFIQVLRCGKFKSYWYSMRTRTERTFPRLQVGGQLSIPSGSTHAVC
jgi:hypothetical protein